MHVCNAMQVLEQKKNTKIKEQWSQQNIAMKHKDHVRKTQLVWVFCIQNFLDAPQALEFLFTFEWFPTPGLE